MDFRNNRNLVLLAFVLFMLGGMALLGDSALVVMVLLGLLFLVRQFDNQAMNSTSAFESELEDEEEWEELTSRQNRPVQSEPVYRHALEAVNRAGLDPDDVQVLAVDIGVMAFKEDAEPFVYRTWALPDDVDYIQPFVQLRLPTKATGRVKFEVLDAAGKPVFIHEDMHNLQRGRNFITPAARLPVHDQLELDGRWQIRVSADGLLLAVHRFEFAEASSSTISQHIGEDGEINTELKAVMAESRLPKMSLDDLLAYQEDEESSSRKA